MTFEKCYHLNKNTRKIMFINLSVEGLSFYSAVIKMKSEKKKL